MDGSLCGHGRSSCALSGGGGRGLRSPLHDALLTDSIPVSARGRAFGFDEAADTAGAVAGPLAALAIVSLFPPLDGPVKAFNIILWVAAIPGVLAALSILLLVKERPRPTLAARRSRARSGCCLIAIVAIWLASSSSAAETFRTRC